MPRRRRRHGGRPVPPAQARGGVRGAHVSRRARPRYPRRRHQRQLAHRRSQTSASRRRVPPEHAVVRRRGRTRRIRRRRRAQQVRNTAGGTRGRLRQRRVRLVAAARKHLPRRQDATLVRRFAHAKRSRRPLRADHTGSAVPRGHRGEQARYQDGVHQGDRGKSGPRDAGRPAVQRVHRREIRRED